jgi:lysophospholipase L1-like esterase
MRLRSGIWTAVVGMLAMSAAAVAQPLPRVAAIGDSLTDEYAEQTYGNVAKSWTQILVEAGRIDMGPTAAAALVSNWGEPRRTGYRDNWARYGETSYEALSFGQHTGVADSVVNHGAEYVVIFIGGNDFNPFSNSAYNNIYNGIWTQDEAYAYADATVANLRSMVGVIEGGNTKIVLASVLDFAFMGFMRNGHFAWSYRDRVTAVLAHCRDRVRALAMEKHLVFLDLFQLNIDLFGSNQYLRDRVLVGNVPIMMQQTGDTGASGFIYDGVHPQRVIQSIWGEAILTALNAGCGTTIPDLSESEMLSIGGLTYGGSDTLAQTLMPMRLYVQNFACPADFNVDRAVGVQDVFDFLAAYFYSDVRADMDASGAVTVEDIFSYLAAYFTGCP